MIKNQKDLSGLKLMKNSKPMLRLSDGRDHKKKLLSKCVCISLNQTNVDNSSYFVTGFYVRRCCNIKTVWVFPNIIIIIMMMKSPSLT